MSSVVSVFVVYGGFHLSFDSDPTVCSLDHTDIITSITWKKNTLLEKVNIINKVCLRLLCCVFF